MSVNWRVDNTLKGDGVDFVKGYLEDFDLSRVGWIKVYEGTSSRYGAGVWGVCHYPDKKQKSYRLSCALKGPFPTTIQTRKRPLYHNEARTSWTKRYGTTLLFDEQEAAAWIVAHEAFHFLRNSRQIPGRNTEIEADAFADTKLNEYRDQRSAIVVFPGLSLKQAEEILARKVVA